MKRALVLKVVTFVPESHADEVRNAMGEAGAGKIGEYTHCSFSIKGTGRFIPGKNAHPAIGKRGKLEAVAEERLEFNCERKRLKDVIRAIKKVHPYEEVPIDIYPVEEIQ